MDIAQDITAIENKVAAFRAILKTDMQKAAAAALPITTKILTMLQSPTGIVIEGLVPQGTAIAADIETAIKAAVPALELLNGIGDVGSAKAVLQRLGATITSLEHGGTHPFSFYVMAFEYVFNLTPALPTAPAA